MNSLEAGLFKVISEDETVTDLLAAKEKSVFAYVPTENASMPVVVFFEQVATPTYTFSERAYIDCLYGVKAIDQGDSMSGVSGIDEALDALLTDGTIAVSGGSVLYCRRESSIAPYTEISDGVRYNHAGGSYRIWTQGE